MASPVSKNVAACLGLVPTVLGGVRRLPAKAVQLPVMAVGAALSGLEAAKREYDELAERGEKLIGRLRGTSFDEVEDKVEDALQGTPVAKLYDKAEDTLEDVGKAAARAARKLTTTKTGVQETLPVDEPVRASHARVDSAAAPEVIAQVEKIASNVAAPLITDHSELPLPDYDHMTLGSLRGRLRSLDMPQLVQLRDYEKSKADRLPVVTMLDNRIAKLANGESVPTGTPDAAPPVAASKPPKKLGVAAAAKTDAPPKTKVRIT